MGVLALIGAYSLLRLNQQLNTAIHPESMAVSISPEPEETLVTPTPVQISRTGTRDTLSVPPPSPSEVAEGVDTRPVPLNKPRPSYADLARNDMVQGVIRARALVGADGLVKDVRLVSHLPDGLDEGAILAVKQMRFRPATKNGQPVNFWQMLEVEFNLR